MIGYTTRGKGKTIAGLLAAIAIGGCSLSSGPPDKPETARIRIEGTSPHQLTLITSTRFFEQLNTGTGERSVVLQDSDTMLITLPIDQVLDLEGRGSIYVELLNPLVPTATVRMRVNLDTGDDSFDQSATMSDQAALIYYYMYDAF